VATIEATGQSWHGVDNAHANVCRDRKSSMSLSDLKQAARPGDSMAIHYAAVCSMH
jgi:hypothetical protein